MNKNDIQLLFDYNYWANARILQQAARLNQEQYNQSFPVSFGGLHGTLAHILGTEMVWRQRCVEGISPPAVPSAEDFATFQDLEQRWTAEEHAMRSFLMTLTDDELSQTIRYKTTRGILHENVLWQPLVHLVNHGTQFRSEAAVILSQLGQSPGDIDLILFIRKRDG